MTNQLHLQIDDGLRRDLQVYASHYGISVSAAVRILIKRGLTDGGWIPAHEEGVITR